MAPFGPRLKMCFTLYLILIGIASAKSTSNFEASSEMMEINSGGGSTQVTGLRLKRETSERDLMELNVAINSAPPGRMRRRRRREDDKIENRQNLNVHHLLQNLPDVQSATKQLLRHHQRLHHQSVNAAQFLHSLSAGKNSNSSSSDFEIQINPSSGDLPKNDEESSTLTSTPTSHHQKHPHDHNHSHPIHPQEAILFLEKATYKILTEIQREFSHINHNFTLALNFLQSVIIQENPFLRENIVVDQNGVTCSHVCDPIGLGFGLLGFCTPHYCTCIKNEEGPKISQFDQKKCPDDLVFDPHPQHLQCRHPADTVLCADPKSETK